jgi:hypothetical protein
MKTKDINLSAYQRMLESGELRYTGKYVAFSNGKLVAYADTEEAILKVLYGLRLPYGSRVKMAPKKYLIKS